MVATPPSRLILASGSPRRRELLERAGLSFEVIVADIDETPLPHEAGRAYVERLARQKAFEVTRRNPAPALVLAADTSVVVDGDILAKPHDAVQARAMLGRLSGRAHHVLTAVALDGPFQASQVVETSVFFRQLTPEAIRWYVDTREPMDKAGAYGIQGIGAMWVEKIEGSVTNVIGLPLAETLELLQRAGWRLPWTNA